MSVKRTQAARTEATRAALVDAARRLFGDKGYSATGTNEVVVAAGVTRGALYHHFTDKQDLFRAVYEAVEIELVGAVAQAALSAPSPLEGLRAGAEAFLDACLDTEVARITLLEAPAVLGWEQWKELDAKYGLGLVRTALQAAMEAGQIAEQPLEPLAHAMLGALTDTALLISRSPEPTRTRAEVGVTLELLIRGLSRPPT